MNMVFTVLVMLQFLSGPHILFAQDKEDTNSTTLSDENRTASELLTADEFIQHFVSLSLILKEYGDDWELFKEKRDEYLATHNITEEHLISFVSDTPGEPEYWDDLWKKIYRELAPAEQENEETDH